MPGTNLHPLQDGVLDDLLLQVHAPSSAMQHSFIAHPLLPCCRPGDKHLRAWEKHCGALRTHVHSAPLFGMYITLCRFVRPGLSTCSFFLHQRFLVRFTYLALQLRPLLPHVHNEPCTVQNTIQGLRDVCSAVLTHYEQHVLPLLAGLRHQVLLHQR